MPRLLSLLPAMLILVLVAACSDDEAEDVIDVVADEQDAALSTDPPPTPFPVFTADPHIQSPQEALVEDLTLGAEAQGWTFEQAMAQHLVSEAAGGIGVRLSAERPDVYVGGALSDEPGGPVSIYIKGPADDFIREVVTSAGIEVIIVDNQPYSAEEMHVRQQAVSEAIVAMGYQNVAVGSHLRAGGRIEASVKLEPGLPEDPAVILAGIPEPLRDSVDLIASYDLIFDDLIPH